MPPELYVEGAMIWGDPVIDATKLADELPPHRIPQPGDVYWNSLVNGTIWKDPDSDDRNIIEPTLGDIVPLTINGFAEGTISELLRVRYQPSAGVYKNALMVGPDGRVSIGGGAPTTRRLSVLQFPDTATSFSSSQTTLEILAQSAKFGSNSLSYAWANAGGGIDINGKTGITISGMRFFPQILNTGGGSPTIAELAALTFQTQYVGPSPTVTKEVGVNISVGNSIVGTPTVTDTFGIDIAIGSMSITQTNVYGIRIPVLGGVSAYGIKNLSSVHFAKMDSKTGAYTMVAGDFAILANATSAAFTVTLPAAANKGHVIYIKKIDSSANAVTVSRAGTDTIEGATSLSLAAQHDSLLLQADGAGIWVRLDL